MISPKQALFNFLSLPQLIRVLPSLFPVLGYSKAARLSQLVSHLTSTPVSSAGPVWRPRRAQLWQGLQRAKLFALCPACPPGMLPLIMLRRIPGRMAMTAPSAVIGGGKAGRQAAVGVAVRCQSSRDPVMMPRQRRPPRRGAMFPRGPAHPAPPVTAIERAAGAIGGRRGWWLRPAGELERQR